MDLVYMGVPRRLVEKVADLIVSDGRASAGPRLLNGWTEETVRRAYRESKENMRNLLEHLATHADQEFGTKALAVAIGVPDWNSVAAMLGPFTRRYKNHYGVVLPPWTQRTDNEEHDHLKMPADIAVIVRNEAGI